jgi:Arc/MetJ family transcription regulator
MRTTLNLSESIINETQKLYNTTNRSNAVESALKDAIRYKKLQNLMKLKGKIQFDDGYLEAQRRAEIDESENNS